MPVALLRSFIDAMPRLEAEEMAKQGNVIAYGGGNMKEGDARSFARRLQQEMRGEEKPRYANPADAARAAGIAIESVEKGR